MASKRRIIDAYYNVDHNYWSNSKGDYIPTVGIPRFTFGAGVLIKLHLIRADGTAVTDYDATSLPHFTLFDTADIPIADAAEGDINNAEALELWEADVENGEFAILLNCNTTEYRDAIAGLVCFVGRMEFSVSVDGVLLGQYTAQVYCDRSLQSETGTSVNTLIALTQQGSVNVQVEDGFSLIEANNTLYNVLGVVLQAPADAADNYGVTSIEPVTTGFKVYYNATIMTAGYVLRYTLMRKG